MTNASTTAPESDTLISLWDEAWVWLLSLFSVFPEPEAVAGEGLTRRVALLLKNWLWSIEGMLRRLMIATALAISARLPAPKPRKPRSKPKAAARNPVLPCFRIFAIRRLPLPPFTGEVPRSGDGGTLQARTSSKAYHHAAFTRDPLLVIGEAPLRRGGPRPARIRPRPDRYHLGRETEESFRTFFGPFHDRSECLRLGAAPPPPRERSETRIGHHILPAFDREAWLAAEAEEKALHPAPGIASHIAALKRLADDPKPAIRRLAQRLRSRPDLVGILGGSLWLTPKKARSDKTPPPPARELVARVCAFVGEFLHPPDTS